MDEIKQLIMKREIKCRYLCVGLSSSHDAPFLNRIAQAGTDLGNFFYIDTSKPNYQEDVKECLGNSL